MARMPLGVQAVLCGLAIDSGALHLIMHSGTMSQASGERTAHDGHASKGFSTLTLSLIEEDEGKGCATRERWGPLIEEREKGTEIVHMGRNSRGKGGYLLYP
jgi:hypothetical protein